MMKMILGELPDSISKPGLVFDYNYEPDWITDPWVVKMIESIDEGSKVISGHVIESPVLGTIPPAMLAGGIKNLILVKFYDENKTWLSTKFGDNCIPWLCDLSFVVDFEMYPRHPMRWAMYGELPVNAQGMAGEPLKTCDEVWVYYMNHYREINEA